MKRDTIQLLYKVKDSCTDIRKSINTYVHQSEDLPQEDIIYLNKVYAAVCEVMDLL